jgi:hypothetical protein
MKEIGSAVGQWGTVGPKRSWAKHLRGKEVIKNILRRHKGEEKHSYVPPAVTTEKL